VILEPCAALYVEHTNPAGRRSGDSRGNRNDKSASGCLTELVNL
jgi:hypothetical protein